MASGQSRLYEFAAGDACLDRVNELIAAATSDLVKKRP